MLIVAVANDNVNHSVGAYVVGDNSSNWLNLKKHYDLVKDAAYANNEPVVAFSYMTCTGQRLSDQICDKETH